METKRELHRRLFNEQVAWIEQCGGNEAGYVAKYGRRDDPRRAGEGGEAIFAADIGALLAIARRLAPADRQAAYDSLLSGHEPTVGGNR